MGLTVNFMPKQEVIDRLQAEYPDFKFYYVEAIKALFTLTNQLDKALETHYKRMNCSRARYLLMMVLMHCDEHRKNPNEIAKSMNVTRGNMTSLVDGLVRDGYVKKYSDVKDRRQVWIELTPKGHQFLKKIFPQNFKRIAKFMSVITKDEVQQLISISKKLQGAMGAFTEEKI